MVADPKLSQSETFTRLPPQRQAAILEVVSDYLLYKGAHGREQRVLMNHATGAFCLLAASSRLSQFSMKITPISGAPDQGTQDHESRSGHRLA